jgi:hypothetical protein
MLQLQLMLSVDYTMTNIQKIRLIEIVAFVPAYEICRSVQIFGFDYEMWNFE